MCIEKQNMYCDLTAVTTYAKYLSCFKLHTLENMLFLNASALILEFIAEQLFLPKKLKSSTHAADRHHLSPPLSLHNTCLFANKISFIFIRV